MGLGEGEEVWLEVGEGGQQKGLTPILLLPVVYDHSAELGLPPGL